MVKFIKISDLKTEEYVDELNMYTELNENQLLHYYEPDIGLFLAESAKVIIRALEAGYEPVSFIVEENHLNTEAKDVLNHKSLEDIDVNVYICDHDLYSSITGLGMTRGMISVMKRKIMPKVSDLLSEFSAEGTENSQNSPKKSRIVILDNVENPTNVGAIFRSAAALFIDAVIMTSSCADPLYRRASRVSMGTVFQIPWTYFSGKSPSKDYYNGLTPEQREYRYIDELHSLGYKVIAMALKDNSLKLNDPLIQSEDKLAIILGNEGIGLPDTTISQCDYTVMIPMAHNVDSLNVAAASAVAFYALTLS